MDRAKLFKTGRSQAVRLPKAYRFDADEVLIRRQGRAVVLEPVEDQWAWLDRLVGPLDDDVVAAMEEEPQAQHRPELDDL